MGFRELQSEGEFRNLPPNLQKDATLQVEEQDFFSVVTVVCFSFKNCE